MTVVPFLKEHPHPMEEEVRHALDGNLCRCTGYQQIVDAIEITAHERADTAVFTRSREDREDISRRARGGAAAPAPSEEVKA